MKPGRIPNGAVVVVALVASCVVASRALAHCDSLDGPVVQDARLALAQGDPTPVLKWVSRAHEDEIRIAFKETMVVRARGADAEALADRFFFETLVRIHRAGEGEGFTGLKPAGSVDPGLAAADASLRSGSAKALAERLSAAVSEGVRQRFALVLERQKQAATSVEAGREYVAAYIDYVHFVENIHRVAAHGAPHEHQEPASHAVAPAPLK